jgi:Recombination endonuclease VII
MDKQKPCSKCRIGKRVWGHSWCKECNRERQVKYSRSDRGKLSARKTVLRRLVGPNGPAEYDRLVALQDNKCAICKFGPEKQKSQSNYLSKNKRLAMDHNHVTGKIRGLLCDQCNRGLGMFKDNPELLRKAVEYLENHGD